MNAHKKGGKRLAFGTLAQEITAIKILGAQIRSSKAVRIVAGVDSQKTHGGKETYTNS